MTDFDKNLKKFQKKIDYTFKDEALIKTAFTHSSFAKVRQNSGTADNERLEFLGDAVLKLLITEVLFKTYPNEDEGVLSKWRSRLVSDKYLASLANAIDLGSYLRFSYGELRSGGDQRASNLANALEALLGACFLDSGIRQCQKLFKEILSYHPPEALKNVRLGDYKTMLQEYAQSKRLALPKYIIVEEKGPEHKKEFCSNVTFSYNGDEISFEGIGETKKESQQVAAQKALSFLNKENS